MFLFQWGYMARTTAFLLECCIDSSSGAVAKAVRPGVGDLRRGDLIRVRSACGRHFANLGHFESLILCFQLLPGPLVFLFLAGQSTVAS